MLCICLLYLNTCRHIRILCVYVCIAMFGVPHPYIKARSRSSVTPDLQLTLHASQPASSGHVNISGGLCLASNVAPYIHSYSYTHLVHTCPTIALTCHVHIHCQLTLITLHLTSHVTHIALWYHTLAPRLPRSQ